MSIMHQLSSRKWSEILGYRQSSLGNLLIKGKLPGVSRQVNCCSIACKLFQQSLQLAMHIVPSTDHGAPATLSPNITNALL